MAFLSLNNQLFTMVNLLFKVLAYAVAKEGKKLVASFQQPPLP